MINIDAAEQAIKPLRADARREVTDAAYKVINHAEIAARQAKTRKLRQARMAVSATVRKTMGQGGAQS